MKNYIQDKKTIIKWRSWIEKFELEKSNINNKINMDLEKRIKSRNNKLNKIKTSRRNKWN